MIKETSPVDPLAFVRTFRANYVNFFQLWKRTGTPVGITLRTPAEEPITERHLPSDLSRLLAEHRESHPEKAIEFYKYMRLENGTPVKVIEDERGLPAEDELLSLSQTLTLTSSSSVRVVTEILVARVHSNR